MIEPRTKNERMAYISGYANAINDIDAHGIDVARGWLREMAACEPELKHLVPPVIQGAPS